MKPEKVFANNVSRMNEKLEEFTLQLPWIERMDMTNDLAPLAPEIQQKIEVQEQKRENLFKGNKRIPYVAPEVDPVLNDFKREILFYRQAQTAVIEGIKKLKELGIPTKRPDDYFAEMAKTDDHMQKVRKHLIAKQEGQLRSEKVRHLREQKKMSKIIQRDALEKRQADKSKHMSDLKAFRKGKLKNLDFLDDDKKGKFGSRKPSQKAQSKDKKFGFGGKKKRGKRNTAESALGTSEYSAKRNSAGTGRNQLKGNRNKNNKNKRAGKNNRNKNRAK